MVYMDILKSSKLSTSNSLTTMLQQGDNYSATNVPLIQPGTQHQREGERTSGVYCLCKHEVTMVTCILLHYAEVMTKFILLAERSSSGL